VGRKELERRAKVALGSEKARQRLPLVFRYLDAQLPKWFARVLPFLLPLALILFPMMC
jgi:hypothetical protein